MQCRYLLYKTFIYCCSKLVNCIVAIHLEDKPDELVSDFNMGIFKLLNLLLRTIPQGNRGIIPTYFKYIKNS